MRSWDVIIVGGGVMGSSLAYHLLDADSSLQVAVVERDPAFTRASSALSVGNIRVQFSLRENILISLHTLDVLRTFESHMSVDGVAPGAGFRPEGNLFLVGDETRERARRAFDLQRSLGCRVDWLPREEVEKKFPLYRSQGYVGATWGAADGHLDCYSFFMGYRRKAESLGARLLHGEVTSIQTSNGRVQGVGLGSGQHLTAAVVVSCAGAWARDLAGLAGVALPVEPRCRQVFVAEPEEKSDTPLPLTNLPHGLYFRSEGDGSLLVGKSFAQDPETTDLRWDRRRFEEQLWPELAAFVPAYDRIRFRRGWAGLYAVNTLDGNAILGEWPELSGFYLANGFSGHGLQQAPAVGRFLSESILGREPFLDLSVFGPERVVMGRPLQENLLV